MSDGKIPLLVLNLDHEVLCVKGSKMGELVSFIGSREEAREMSIRNFLTKKLTVSQIRFLGMHDLPDRGLTAALMVLDEGYVAPKGMEFLELAKALTNSQEAFTLYSAIVLKGFVPPSKDIISWPLGENELDGSLLGSMVARGIKTGSSSLLIEYQKNQELLPKENQVSVILDWESHALCVIQTQKVAIVPFGSVTEQQAKADAFGDGTLSYWQDVHWDLFDSICQDEGEEMGDDLDVVCERFLCIKSLI
ncbi:MAG: ASCH domain-containing protein [Pseudomonadota bacterium]